MLTVLYRFGIGGVFDAIEDTLKDHLKAGAEAELATVYGGDSAKLIATVNKAWAYYKRAHLHGGAIGPAALACMLLAAMVRPASWIKAGVGVALGVGGLANSAYWLWAGYPAPALGRTSAGLTIGPPRIPARAVGSITAAATDEVTAGGAGRRAQEEDGLPVLRRGGAPASHAAEHPRRMRRSTRVACGGAPASHAAEHPRPAPSNASARTRGSTLLRGSRSRK